MTETRHWTDRLLHPHHFVVGLTILTLGLAWTGNTVVSNLRRGSDRLTVTGASTQRVTSDRVTWRITVNRQAATLAAAYEALQPDLDRTIRFLQANGVQAAEIQRGVINSFPIYQTLPNGSTTNEVAAYRASQVLTIESAEVARIQTLSQEIGQLLTEGVNLEIAPPAYTFSKLPEYRVELLAKATEDARKRAAAIAQQGGSNLAAIASAETGVFQITAPNSTDVGDGGSYDTSTIEKDMTAVISVSFRLN
ncbi:SIMPL domain-containing protein [Synechococcus elongatus IITB4]|uniref:SIMPL domain-containing protein n=1 Tax=Synechococcus elongatus TaxID=32046 RepID=UPI0030D29DEE